MENTVVKVEDVSMMFNMSQEKVDNIKEYIIKMLKHELMFHEFWALKNVSFELKKGDSLGIVGLNGSGKRYSLKSNCRSTKANKRSRSNHGKYSPIN